MRGVAQQLRNNSVALISLVIAVTALGYNTWRNETTEAHRNVRHAAFRVLESLGELQQVVDYRYYYLAFEPGRPAEGEWRIRGYGHVAMIRDLMMLMPEPAPTAGAELQKQWQEQFAALDDLDANARHTADAVAAERELTQSIEAARSAVLAVLKRLE